MIKFESAYKQLSPPQRVFVDGYVSDLETLAVKNHEKMVDLLGKIEIPASDERSMQMLNNSIVKAAIVERVQEITQANELTAYRTIKELQCLAYSNMGDYCYVDEGGNVHFDLGKCTPEQWAAVKSIEYEQKLTGPNKIKLQLHDKPSSLYKLMEYQGLTNDEHWRSEQAKSVNKTIDNADNVEDIAQKYAECING